jgi:pyrroline-5-carboxylate reductase
MKDSYIIGIIGAGNMGEALIRGLLRSQLVRPYEIIASARTKKKLNRLEKTYGIHTTLDNLQVVGSTDTLILAVKPQNMDGLFRQIKPHMEQKHLVISIAAGIDMARMRKGLGKKPRLIRTMPNLPALVDEGVTAIYTNSRLPERYRRFAHQIFQAVGTTVDLRDEKQMDVITAVSGTGPAYFFAMMEGLRDAGMKLGLPRKLAEELMKQTVIGAADIVGQTGKTPEDLRSAVTSEKGTTWAAMNVFKERDFWKLMSEAVKAAAKRSHELRTARK